MDRFKGDEGAVLVATDVAARGLDIPWVRCPHRFNSQESLPSFPSISCRRRQPVFVYTKKYHLLNTRMHAQVRHVVHFDLPQNPDSYTHRSGRAAHRPGEPRGCLSLPSSHQRVTG